jgi:hypothetical protein
MAERINEDLGNSSMGGTVDVENFSPALFKDLSTEQIIELMSILQQAFGADQAALLQLVPESMRGQLEALMRGLDAAGGGDGGDGSNPDGDEAGGGSGGTTGGGRRGGRDRGRGDRSDVRSDEDQSDPQPDDESGAGMGAQPGGTEGAAPANDEAAPAEDEQTNPRQPGGRRGGSRQPNNPRRGAGRGG